METALLVVGGILSAVGTLASANAQAQAYKYNAKVSDINADMATQTAAENERRQRILNAKKLGDIRAGYGASGLTIDGSPQDVLEESAAAAELDALTIRHGGLVEATGYRNDARLARSQASSTMTKGYISAATDLLGSGSKVIQLNRS